MNLGVTGKKGEDMVASFLRKNGCTIIKRNYSCRFGEIDIIAKKGEILLFVEVKTRQQNSLVSPREAVDGYKQNRMTLAAEDYMVKTETYDLQPRFDVAEVTVCKKENDQTGYKLNYIKNAF